MGRNNRLARRNGATKKSDLQPHVGAMVVGNHTHAREENVMGKGKWHWLPDIGSAGYYTMLALVGTVLGLLGGVTAAYMNFSLGFFVGGQVLAGILGSTITLGYGPDGKHGANYMQTMAASVAGMSGMAVLVQAMVWLGLPQPPSWQLVLYFTCIGMFGVGVGMLYTPILVDRMNLTFPSGLAVANILRALTNPTLLKRSIGKLGAGAGVGFIADMAATLSKPLQAMDLAGNITTIGAGMIVGARITIPAIVVGLIGESMVPYLVSIGWLEEGQPFRKIFFIIALGTILGAAIVDMSIIFYKVASQVFDKKKIREVKLEEADWKRVNRTRLILWVVFWGIALTFVASYFLQQPLGYVLLAIGLVFGFVLINGISTGISDSNPISSAFVLTVLLMAAIGLEAPGVALMCGAILLVSTSSGVDMQQDRSTGKRLETNRVHQFRYQAGGIIIGAIMLLVFAWLFMEAYPVLGMNQHDKALMEAHPEAKKWQSAMTYKFVGAITGITEKKPFIMTALEIGIAIGLLTEALRKLLHAWKGYKKFTEGSKFGYGTGFVIDAIVLPTPYASSFGGFVDLTTSVWFGLGGIISSFAQTMQEEGQEKTKMGTPPQNAPPEAEEALPEDMSTTSLTGGGIIAGASLSALAYGIYMLLSKLL